MSGSLVDDSVLCEEPAGLEATPTSPAVHGKLPDPWNAAQWTEKVMNEVCIRDASSNLQKSLDAFQATKNEIKDLLESKRQFDQVLDAAEKEYTKQKETSQSIAKTPWGPLWLKLKSGYKLFSRTAFLYSEHLDAMLLLAPSYVKLAWGGIHLLLAVQVSDEKLKECVEDHLLKISKNFDLIEALTAYIPSGKMVRALAEAYACYLQFLQKAVYYYQKNRFKRLATSITRPWESEFQPSVDSIASAIDHICQIGQVYQVGAINEILRAVQRLEESREKIVEIRYVVLGDVKDNDELCGMLDQRLAERFDDLSTSSTQKIASSRITPNGGVQDLELPVGETTAYSAGDSAFSLDDLEAFREFACPDLHAQDQYLAQKKENVEQRSDMVEGRRKRNNILKLDAVISWLESDHSKLLWIDGNNILDHNMWNATFAFPILVDATSNYELAVILRYFCGELGTSTKVNSVSTLLQAFIYQTLQQHLSVFKARPELLSRERLVNARNSFDTLWSLFRDCLETCGASYILITIDSVDRLQTETMPDSETRSSFNIEQLIDALNMLAQDRKKLVKILLTARLASKAAESSSAAEQALTLHRPHRRLSVDVILQERPLFPAKMREIAEGKCKHILFEEVWMLYPPQNGYLRF